jgi:hypothetical protein
VFKCDIFHKHEVIPRMIVAGRNRSASSLVKARDNFIFSWWL